MSFYVLGLLLLVLFFRDEVIEWHEACIMFAIYIAYGIFMKYNTAIEAWVRGTLFKVDAVKEMIPENDDITRATSRRRSTINSDGTATEHRKSIPVLHSGAMFRAGLAHMALDDNEPTEISSLPATSRHEVIQTSSINNHHNSKEPNVINNGKTVLISTATPPKLNKMRSFPAYVGAPGNLNGIRKSPKHGKKPLKEIQNNGVPPVEVSFYHLRMITKRD
uniref:Uncharacterized protein n=1 Tax=Panagrolaimus superbus TaxID=310955 RepID=A0A914YER4_9BILA